MAPKGLSGSMFRFALGQMRLSMPRLVAGGLAVALGAAFVAATLMSGTVMRETTRNSVAAGYAQADLVLNDSITARQLAALRGVPGITVAGGRMTASWGGLTGPRGSATVPLGSLMPDPALEPQRLVSGRWPVGPQVALPEAAANRLGVRVGDTVEHRLNRPSGRNQQTRLVTLTVSAITRDPAKAFSSTGGLGLVPLPLVQAWARFDGSAQIFDNTLIKVAPGVDDAQVRIAAQGVLNRLGPAAGPYGQDGPLPVVQTVQQAQDQQVARLTGDTRIVTVVLVAFAAIAMVVAAMVIANTFQVLVAQRVRTLALLRCAGALKRQLRRSVLIEALLVGLGASLTGVLVGAALAQLALQVLRRLEVAEQLPGSVVPNWTTIVWPVLIGTTVTVLASLSPARAATRVSPLAALRPDEGPGLRERAGRVRLASSAALVLIGSLMLAAGLVGTWLGAPTVGLGLGILGGALSFLGLLIGTVFWVPRLTGLLTGPIARTGAPAARLAAANSVRNPRRTASTASALLIGVTLVSLMTTGAASARASLASQLDTSLITDIIVSGQNDGAEPSSPAPALTAKQRQAVTGVAGLAAVREVLSAPVAVRAGSGSGTNESADNSAFGIDADDARTVLRSGDVADALARGELVMGRDLLAPEGEAPSTAQIRRGDGAWRTVRVSYALDDRSGWLIMPVGLLREVAPDATVSTAWLRVASDADPVTVSEAVGDAVTNATAGGTVPAVLSPAVERHDYDRAINGVLAIVLGLLGISVVIAVVGVANTLSLSVIERRRESATLRTIGLTRRQLRWTLAIEGMVLAGVGAICGITLGVVYGWIGTTTVLGGGSGRLGSVQLELPLVQLGAVLLVAVLAGLLASVLPSWSAAKASPVAALATT